jgi:hypothetical protein
MHRLPSTGYLRLPQILGCPKDNIPTLIPVSKSAWWAGIKAGCIQRWLGLFEQIRVIVRWRFHLG